MSNQINRLREFGKFRLDADKKILWFENKTVNLTLKEIEILCVLTESSELVTKDELMKRVWQSSFVEESNLSKNIYLLRKTLAKYGESDEIIETVPKRGYRFIGEVKYLTVEPQLIIEKHSITRTVIEEIKQSDPPNMKALLPKSTKNRLWIPILAGFAILAAGFGYFTYNQKNKNVEKIKSIAVLPLKSYKNATDETLPIRITDAVITRLGSSDKIIVRPTNSIVSFTNDERDAVEIGKKLQTETILDGRIQQENDRVRITFQLINVVDGTQLWAGQIDGISSRILVLQDEISNKILQTLDPSQTELSAAPTNNSDAYEAYLQGRYFVSRRSNDGMQKAAEFFQKSIEADPNFAEAYAALADTQYLLYDYAVTLDKSIIEKSKENLKKALLLKPNLTEALVTQGTIEESIDREWKNADLSLKKAVESSPNNSFARYRYGAVLLRLGRFDEAQNHLEKAIESDPLSIVAYANLGMAYHCKKDYATAETQYRKIFEISDKISTPHWLLARTLWLAGKKDESVKEILRALAFEGNNELVSHLKTNSSPENVIKELLKEWEKRPNNTTLQYIAYFYANIGEREKAINRLEEIYDKGITSISWLKSAPEYDSLKNEPRYQALLQKMKL
jgi:DNA-binding winged helix-turn-helix (wHTH) protein/TolB-like protein/tetratricopeptide (TPR) repeat protein